MGEVWAWTQLRTDVFEDSPDTQDTAWDVLSTKFLLLSQGICSLNIQFDMEVLTCRVGNNSFQRTISVTGHQNKLPQKSIQIVLREPAFIERASLSVSRAMAAVPTDL